MEMIHIIVFLMLRIKHAQIKELIGNYMHDIGNVEEEIAKYLLCVCMFLVLL